MSRSLRDSAVNHLNEALSLMKEGKHKEASVSLELAEEASLKAKEYDVFLYVQTIKGNLMQILCAYEEALKLHSFSLKSTEDLLSKDPDNEFYQSIFQTNLDAIGTLGNLFYKIGRFTQPKNCYELHLSISQKLLQNDPENVAYQSYVGTTLNNLGNLLKNMGRIDDAKDRYEKSLDMRQRLLQKDPENVAYQSDVAMTLNNLGALLKNMGRIDDAKDRYNEALKIYTEPMQYLTIGRKSNSIIRLIKLNTEQAEKETNSHLKIKYLEEAYQICKKNQEFFNKHGMKHEKNLVMEAGFSA